MKKLNILESLPYYVGLIRKNKTTLLDTYKTYLIAKTWGVQVGKNCKFNGIPKIWRRPKSSILIGDNCKFNSSESSTLMGVDRPCYLSTVFNHSSIKIGDNCGFTGTIIISCEAIHLGNNVTCGLNTVIADSNFKSIKIDDRKAGVYGDSKPITISDGVFLGMFVMVLKGVTIGENSIIAAGSVVTKDIPPNVIAAGVPAKVIKEIQQEQIKS